VIDASASSDAPPAHAALPPTFASLLRRRLVDERRPGAPLVVALDVDGTIAPIVPRPEDAAVPPETRRVLASLAARPAVQLAVVSGRSAADAARIVALDGLWVIGNHGAETVAPDGAVRVDPLVAPFAPAIAAAVRALAPAADAVPGARLEDKRWTLTLHYRRVADAAAVGALERATSDAARAFGLSMHRGKQVFELRPPVRVDKGTALLRLARALGADVPGAALLFAGDDLTDEDAFVALRAELPNALTIKVVGEEAGEGGARGADVDTAAAATVVGLPTLRAALEQLDAWLGNGG
jgi:trehalose-phosphatase